MHDYVYRIEVHLFDHVAAQKSNNSKRLFDTKTGLAHFLDLALLRQASTQHLFLPKGVWNPLPITRELSESNHSQELGSAVDDDTSWPALGQSRGPPKPLAPREAKEIEQSPAVIDFRFGPLSIDWIDNPRPSSSKRFAASSPLSTSSSTSMSYFSPPIYPSSSTQSSELDWRQAEASGSTDLYWGSIHLYREAGASESSSKAERDASIKQDDGTQLGMVSVPGNLSAVNILAFIAPALDSIAQVRVLKDSTPNRQIVLLRFRDSQSAAEFKRMYQGRTYYGSPESEVCHVVSISTIKFKSSSTPPFTSPWVDSREGQDAPGGAVELPTCPVCLERLDANVTGLMQTSCTHTFHCSCLLKWGDSRCPICRSTNFRTRRPTLSTPAVAVCSTCKSNANLWMCTICGNVGCGRYQGGHAAKHYEQSGHLYSLELETQRIWDYEGDMYVHRLIRSRTDGKVVELPSQMRGTTTVDDHHQASLKGGSGPDRTDEESQDKIEAMGIEYANLMSTQLDAQRVYWEGEVARLKDECAVLRSRWDETTHERARWRKERVELERKIDALERSLADAAKAHEARVEAMTKQSAEDEARRKKERTEAAKTKRELEKQLEAERAVTASLTANLSHVRDEVTKRDQEMKATRAQVDELTEQMRDVMFALTARDKIEAEGGASELQGGSIALPSPPPPPPAQTGSPASSARKKKNKR